MKVPTDKAHRIKNYVDKDEALGAKKLIMSKGVIRKYPLGFDPSGNL